MMRSSSPEEGLIDELKAERDELKAERDEARGIARRLRLLLLPPKVYGWGKVLGDLVVRHPWLTAAEPTAEPGAGEKL